jgi:hypothetical protein
MIVWCILQATIGLMDQSGNSLALIAIAIADEASSARR